MFLILLFVAILTRQVHAENRALTEDEIFQLVKAGFVADAKACENPGKKWKFKLFPQFVFSNEPLLRGVMSLQARSKSR